MENKLLNILNKYDTWKFIFTKKRMEIMCYSKYFEYPTATINLSSEYNNIIKGFILRKQLEGKNLIIKEEE